VLIMLVLGGTGRLYGAFVGSAVFLLLRHLLSEHSPAFWQFWLGALVVLLTFFARGGLLGAADRLLALLPRRPAAPASAKGRP
jgi:branched-chain amino acid transport system permease protein